MKELLQALAVIKKYNAMSFDLFIKEYEAHIGKKVPLSTLADFSFTGLTNVAFMQSSRLYEVALGQMIEESPNEL